MAALGMGRQDAALRPHRIQQAILRTRRYEDEPRTAAWINAEMAFSPGVRGLVRYTPVIGWRGGRWSIP